MRDKREEKGALRAIEDGGAVTAEDAAEEMRRLWGGRTPGLIGCDRRKETAVLVPLLEREGELHVLFEVRASSLHSQPGEVCFPGGAMEPGETPMRAAVRETMEELLVGEGQIRILAPLDILCTPANLTVHPYLAFLSDYGGTFSPAEVGRVFSVPLSWLREHEPRRHMTRVLTIPGEDFPYESIPGGRNYRWREGSYSVLFYHFGETVIWGMTAKILSSFLAMAAGGTKEDQPAG